jgi:4-oxalocrotonate tautomerase
MIEGVTEAMIAVEGEKLRDKTWVKINEIAQGDWAIGGKLLGAADVQALQSAA